MKKIIKQGNTDFFLTCPMCKCEFIYDINEINALQNVKCPCCDFSVFHTKSIPAIAKELEKCIDEAYYSSL